MTATHNSHCEDMEKRVNDLEKLVQEKEVEIATDRSLAFSFMDEIHEESNDSLGDQDNGQLRTSTLCLQLKDQVEITERETKRSREKDLEITRLREEQNNTNVEILNLGQVDVGEKVYDRCRCSNYNGSERHRISKTSQRTGNCKH